MLYEKKKKTNTTLWYIFWLVSLNRIPCSASLGQHSPSSPQIWDVFFHSLSTKQLGNCRQIFFLLFFLTWEKQTRKSELNQNFRTPPKILHELRKSFKEKKSIFSMIIDVNQILINWKSMETVETTKITYNQKCMEIKINNCSKNYKIIVRDDHKSVVTNMEDRL